MSIILSLAPLSLLGRSVFMGQTIRIIFFFLLDDLEEKKMKKKLTTTSHPLLLGSLSPSLPSIERSGTFTQERPASVEQSGWLRFLFWEGGTLWVSARVLSLTFFFCSFSPITPVSDLFSSSAATQKKKKHQDAFFTCASAQVGQVILALPHALRQTGLFAGIALLLLFASLAMWTVYLMVSLYLDHKNREIKRGAWYERRPAGDDGEGSSGGNGGEDDTSGRACLPHAPHPSSAPTPAPSSPPLLPPSRRRGVAVQYHEVMGDASYRWIGTFSKIVVIIALGGLAVAQIIASSSNFHGMIPGVSKRDWALVFGGIAMTMSLLPSFRNFRAFSFLALVATTFTAWFMVSAGIKGSGGHGLQAAAWRNQTPSEGWHGFMAGAAQIIFVFGGHAMLFEVMDAMFQPYKFHRVFYGSYLYVYTLILPNSIFVVSGWFDEAAKYGNVFAYFPPSVPQKISIVLMVLHQVIVFALFAFPLYFMAEKAVGVHEGAPLWKRYLVRLPIGLLLWLVALAFPFFGVINEVLGAFTTSFETYIIPPLVYNILYFHRADAALNRESAPKPPPVWIGKKFFFGGGDNSDGGGDEKLAKSKAELERSWEVVKWFNWIIVAFTAVFGFGLGGYASIKALVDAASTFGLFAKCYNC